MSNRHVHIYLYTLVVLSRRENSSNGAPQCENKALPISKHQIMKLISVIAQIAVEIEPYP
jgi:hypothetical protein